MYPSFTFLGDIIGIDCISDISIDASNKITDKQNKDMNTTKCEYRLSMIDNVQCQNLNEYQCSHCSSLYCLEHSLQHQEDLKEEVSYLLDEAQVS